MRAARQPDFASTIRDLPQETRAQLGIQHILHPQLTADRLPEDLRELPILRAGQPAHPVLAHAQRVEFALERASVSAHIARARQFVRDQLPQNARIAVLELSAGSFKIPKLQPDSFTDRVVQTQFGGRDDYRLSQGFRVMLGMEADDPRFVVWDVQKDPDINALPDPETVDAFLVTGGAAMPSELDGNTANTKWLKIAVAGMKSYAKQRVPGLPVCLGHQLWSYSQGALVGKASARRELGTVHLNTHSRARNIGLLQGVLSAEQQFRVSATHCESVLTLPQGAELLFFNGYSKFQGMAFPPRGMSVAEANNQDSLVVSLQHHPEITASFLHFLFEQREAVMMDEGIDTRHMLFQDVPGARQIFINFLEMTARRTNKRLSR